MLNAFALISADCAVYKESVSGTVSVCLSVIDSPFFRCFLSFSKILKNLYCPFFTRAGLYTLWHVMMCFWDSAVWKCIKIWSAANWSSKIYLTVQKWQSNIYAHLWNFVVQSYILIHVLLFLTVSFQYKMSKISPLCSYCVSLGALGKVLPIDWMHAGLVLYGGRNCFQNRFGNRSLSHILHHIIPVWMLGRKTEVAWKDRGRYGIITCSCHAAFLYIHIS